MNIYIQEENFSLPCSLLLDVIVKDNGGGNWIFDEDDFVILRITAGTSPSMYFEVGVIGKSADDALGRFIDEAASDDGVDWFCWWWCSFSKRIRHQSGA